MTNEEILKLAREAGINDHFLLSPIMVQMQCGSWAGIIESLEKFSALVAAAEREKCISDINAISQEYDERGMLHERQKCINVILARGVTKP